MRKRLVALSFLSIYSLNSSKPPVPTLSQDQRSAFIKFSGNQDVCVSVTITTGMKQAQLLNMLSKKYPRLMVGRVLMIVDERGLEIPAAITRAYLDKQYPSHRTMDLLVVFQDAT